MRDYVAEMNDKNIKVPKKLREILNKFFSDVDYTGGDKDFGYHKDCVIRGGDHEETGAVLCLIIESSIMYHAMQGEYGWEVHTKFHEAFVGSGYSFEMANSCVICFYED